MVSSSAPKDATVNSSGVDGVANRSSPTLEQIINGVVKKLFQMDNEVSKKLTAQARTQRILPINRNFRTVNNVTK